ncbi:hypothetical protein TvY486_0009030 [Trypanosoma vivax Y486]|uniref:Uncharacterized protein n=1 Tax=Trypanosoma vivax (strain Y486) TaxID=1055687 RepID=F9WL57_TRYVY|nr:hypothetical protein TvY486_0009030 [Trypanosoma vivax Y486]|eukprot:CCD18244.1 hypothetical protein TvY486_0009030 [Trypanosoma vivax Y486]
MHGGTRVFIGCCLPPCIACCCVLGAGHRNFSLLALWRPRAVLWCSRLPPLHVCFLSFFSSCESVRRAWSVCPFPFPVTGLSFALSLCGFLVVTQALWCHLFPASALFFCVPLFRVLRGVWICQCVSRPRELARAAMSCALPLPLALRVSRCAFMFALFFFVAAFCSVPFVGAFWCCRVLRILFVTSFVRAASALCAFLCPLVFVVRAACASASSLLFLCFFSRRAVRFFSRLRQVAFFTSRACLLAVATVCVSRLLSCTSLACVVRLFSFCPRPCGVSVSFSSFFFLA